MCMSKVNICDYSDYDYKTEFWTKKNREYEHQLEFKLVNKLLKKYSTNGKSICDAGCGFGRLFESYCHLFSEYHLVDYAKNLLKQAKDIYGMKKNIHFYKQSLYELNISKKADAIISIRTLHHLEDVDQLIKKLYDNLNEGGCLILDIPNHYHIKNKIKRPFSIKKNKIKVSAGYFNYNPQFIIEKIQDSGFNIVDKRQVGLFRVGFIKQIFPPSMLISFEGILNMLLSSFNIGPSVYIVAKKQCG